MAGCLLGGGLKQQHGVQHSKVDDFRVVLAVEGAAAFIEESKELTAAHMISHDIARLPPAIHTHTTISLIKRFGTTTLLLQY